MITELIKHLNLKRILVDIKRLENTNPDYENTNTDLISALRHSAERHFPEYSFML
jgi:hypothetical protein